MYAGHLLLLLFFGWSFFLKKKLISYLNVVQYNLICMLQTLLAWERKHPWLSLVIDAELSVYLNDCSILLLQHSMHMLASFSSHHRGGTTTFEPLLSWEGSFLQVVPPLVCLHHIPLFASASINKYYEVQHCGHKTDEQNYIHVSTCVNSSTSRKFQCFQPEFQGLNNLTKS